MGPKRAPKVVIVGGGFAGIAAVQRLNKTHARCDITLVTKQDAFEYYPGLYKLVTGALAMEVSVPYSVMKRFRGVSIEKGVFTSVDPARQVVILEDGKEIPYDYLVLALGSETNYFNIAGLPDLSYSFKSVREALRLKRHFCDIFGVALALPKDEAVAKLHTVIVGGGPSGVELAGDLMHYLRELAQEIGVDPSFVTIDLIEAGSRVLPMLPENVSRAADARLRKMKINLYTNRSITSQDINEVTMSNMNFTTNTVIWTAGTRINSAYKTIPNIALNDRGRIVVDEHLALPHDNHIFVIGDGAATPYSGLAQTAIHNGSYVGGHIHRLLKGEKRKVPYVPKKVSYVIPIGNFWAMFITGTKVVKGLLPWLLRTFIDLRYLFSIVSLGYLVKIIRKGHKYRHSKVYCPIE